MRFKNINFIFVISILLLIPLILAYNYQINVDSNYAVFNTDVYKCSDSGCSDIIFHQSSTNGQYSLIDSGDNYYAEYDYKSCFKSHIYRLHVWGDLSETENYNIVFNKKENCQGNINNGELSENNISLGETVTITSNVHSGFEYPAGIPETTAIPDNIKDEYSTNTKLSIYANDIKINEAEAEILLASDKDFSFDWTPSSAGVYEIIAKSEIIDCACSSQETQTYSVGSVVVNDVPPVLNTYYRDSDNDGYGDAGNSIQAATQPVGYVTDNTDCNDNNANIHPNANEICNGIDDNCNGQIDEGVKNTYYLDSDGDTYGGATIIQACSLPAGYSTNSNDCDDNVFSCNTDCNSLKYFDLDGDGYGNFSNSHRACDAPVNCITDNTDCNDNNANIHPNANEICNGIDDNCNGQIDEGSVCGTDTFAPIVNLLSPVNNQIFYGVSYLIDFIFSVNDASDISGCYVDVSGNQHQNTTSITKTGNNTISVNLNQGVYTAQVFCTDIFNNHGNSSQINFEIAQIQCSVDSDCIADYYENKYCSGNNIYRKLHDFSCVDQVCTENIKNELIKECNHGCKNGECKSGGSETGCIETNSCELTYDDNTEFDDSITLESTDSTDKGINQTLNSIMLNTNDSEAKEPISYFWVFVFVIAIIVILILLFFLLI